MFTGIVEELGVVDGIEEQPDAIRLTVRGPFVTTDAALGDSIAVNGCCLTVAVRDGETFTADVMRETLAKTSLGALEVGSRVNLERAVTPQTRLGGHIVQGHVDGTGRRRTPRAERALGGRRGRAPGRPGPLPRAQGVDHGRRHLADRRGGLDRLDEARPPGRAPSRSA